MRSELCSIQTEINIIMYLYRMENREQVNEELNRVKPDYILNAAGITV